MKKSLKISGISLFLILISYSFSIAQPWMQSPFMNTSKTKVNFYDVKNAFKEWSKDKDLKKIKGLKAFKRWEWFWEPRVYPTGEMQNSNLYWTESQKFRQSNTAKSVQNSMWISVSPNVIPQCADTTNIIGMGRINCITFHPTDTNIVFIGASQGGVWKSVDGGNNWMCLTDDLPVIRISHIAINPVDPNIIYIATGDIDDIAFNPMTEGRPYNFGVGILKSVDGGATWNTTGLNFNVTDQQNTLLRKIIINPVNPDELLVGGFDGTWKSLDAGANWIKVNSYRIIDMDENPLNYKTVYAATFYNPGMSASKRIYKSFDFGDTWVELNTGMPTGTAIARVELAVTKADTNYLYAITCKQHGGAQGIYKSINAGDTWTKLANTPNVLGWADGGLLAQYTGVNFDTTGQGWYDLTIIVDPLDKNKLYTGGVNMWGSSNGGTTWNIVSMWVKYFGNSLHADQHYSLFHPITHALYQSNDGGIYRTHTVKIGSLQTAALPPPFGLGCVNLQTMEIALGCYTLPTTWKNLGNGIQNTEFYRLGLCKANADMIVAGAQDNGTYMYKNGSWLNTLGGDGMEAMVANNSDNTIYATNYSGALSRSDDGGLNYVSGLDSAITNAAAGNEQGQWVTPYIMDPFNSDVIYGGFQNVWKSQDKGASWTKLGDNSGNPYRTLAICQSDNNYIYATRDDMVYRSTDAGLTWTLISTNLPTATNMCTYIAVDGYNPLKVWITFSGYTDINKVFASADGGDTWTNISDGLPNVPVNCIARNDESSSDIYVGTDIGIYLTNDSIQNTPNKWMLYSNGLPNVIVNELEMSYSIHKLRAATYGRGLWEADLYPYIITNTKENLISKNSFSVSPNPNTGKFAVNLKLDKAQIIDITIFSSIGEKMISFNENASGNYTKNLDIKNLKNGIYILQVKTETSYFTTKIIKD